MADPTASVNQPFAGLDLRYQSNVCVYAFQIVHENLCTCGQHAEWCKQISQSEAESVRRRLHLIVLLFLQFSLQTDPEFCDRMLLIECEFLFCHYFPSFFAYLLIDILHGNFPGPRAMAKRPGVPATSHFIAVKDQHKKLYTKTGCNAT